MYLLLNFSYYNFSIKSNLDIFALYINPKTFINMCKFTVTLNEGCGSDPQPNFNDLVIPKTKGLVFKSKSDATQDDSKLEKGDRYYGYVENCFIHGVYLGGDRTLKENFDILTEENNL